VGNILDKLGARRTNHILQGSGQVLVARDYFGK